MAEENREKSYLEYSGDPINTQSGNYFERISGLSIPFEEKLMEVWINAIVK